MRQTRKLAEYGWCHVRLAVSMYPAWRVLCHRTVARYSSYALNVSGAGVDWERVVEMARRISLRRRPTNLPGATPAGRVGR
jgi:hypothetical protein